MNTGIAVATGGPWKFHRCDLHDRCYLVACGHSVVHFRPDEYDAFVNSIPGLAAAEAPVTP
jgi:hypothetical protein